MVIVSLNKPLKCGLKYSIRNYCESNEEDKDFSRYFTLIIQNLLR